MYRRPTSPEEFARPCGCAEVANRSNNAAEFTAPHDATTNDAPTRTVSPFRSISTASTFFPVELVNNRRARALVHNVMLEHAMAASTQHDCASPFIRNLHGNELQVAQSSHPSGSPG